MCSIHDLHNTRTQSTIIQTMIPKRYRITITKQIILLRAIPTLNGNSWRLHLSVPSNDCICVGAPQEHWGDLGLQLSGICGAVYVSFTSVVCICHLYLSFVSVLYICHLYLQSVSVIYICRLYLSFISVVCICRLQLSFVSVAFICHLYLSFVSVVLYLSFIPVVYICQVEEKEEGEEWTLD